MLAHGANPDAMSEHDYELVMVALNDGLFGNKSLLSVTGALTTGAFNYIRSQSSKAYTLHDVIGIMHDYIYPPISEQEKKNLVSENLLAFMSMNPNSAKFFNQKNDN